MTEIIKYFEKNNGYVRDMDLKKKGFHSLHIKQIVDNGTIIRVKPGLYRLAELTEPGNVSFDFVDIAKAAPDSVICILSALSYYDLTTYINPLVHIAVERDKKIPKIYSVKVKGYYFSEKTFNLGINKIETKYGIVRIYDREKSICDIFRYKNKIGEDIAYECLKNYVNSKNTDFFKLKEYAKICRVAKIINSSIKTLLG